MCYETLCKAAEYLGIRNDISDLRKLQLLAEDGRLFVTFWGHFSAGKSKLINNLLESDLLPVKPKESTAVLTYLQYGTVESALLCYLDGRKDSCPIEYVKEMFEGTREPAYQLAGLESIQIFLPHPLLANGLVIVDTPGVNTLLKNHQASAVSAIQSAGLVVYVMGGATTQSDLDFIEMIADTGINITFVRTKCDQFLMEEEDSRKTIAQQEADLSERMGEPIAFYPVSNEQDSAEWFSGIKTFREMMQQVSMHTEGILKESCAERGMVYAAKYLEQLREREKTFVDMMQGQNALSSKEIHECQANLNKIKKILLQREEKLQKELSHAKADAETSLKELCEKHTDRFYRRIDAIPFGDEYEQEYHSVCMDTIKDANKNMQEMIHAAIDHVLEADYETLGNQLPDMEMPPSLSYSEIEEDALADMEEYRNQLQEARYALDLLQEQKSQLSEEQISLQQDLDSNNCEEIIKEIDKQLMEIPNQPMMRQVENTDAQPSEIFRRVGEAADWALLLLPEGTIAKGVSTIAKAKPIAQVLNKTGKLAKAISPLQVRQGIRTAKRAGMWSRLRKAMNARPYAPKKTEQLVQKVIDNGAKKVEDNIRGARKQEGSLLDAITVAYWMEKVGRNFDEPPRLEVDMEEEMKRKALRHQLIYERNAATEEAIRQKKAMNLLKSQQDEFAERERQQQRTIQAIEKKMKDMERNARKERTESFRKEYRIYFKNYLNKIAKHMIEAEFAAAQQNLGIYFEKRNSFMIASMEDKKASLKKIEDVATQGKEKLQQEIELCRSHIHALEMIAK